MSYIEKGIILTIEGEADRNNNKTKARVQSKTAEGTTTLPLTIPWYLRGSMGMLKKGTEVVYALFDDATGVILARMDGNWEGKMEETRLFIDLMDTTATVQGSIDVSDGITGDNSVINSMEANTIKVNTLTGDSITDSGVRLAHHTHGGVTSGDSDTGEPNGGSGL